MRRPRRAALLALGLAGAAWLAAPAGAAGSDPDWKRAGAETARLLSDLIRIDTTNPPGNEGPAAERLLAFFAGERIRAELFVPSARRANLIARLPATRPGPDAPLLLLSHLDVVPADPDSWTFPPFSGAIRNDHVYGRGALDDKGQAAVFAVALALLERHGGERRRDLVYCAAADEETDAAAGVRWLIERHWQALGPPGSVWNEGGASARLPLLGGATLNAIATTEKRALWLRLTSEGEGGHGSQPVRDGANQRLVRALARIDGYATPLRVTASVAETFRRVGSAAGFPANLLYAHLGNPLVLRLLSGRLEGNRITNAMLRDTIALTGLSSGLKHNVIPRRAEALLDVRLLPDSDAQAFLASLVEVIADPAVRVEPLAGLQLERVPDSPWDHELFRAIGAEMEREIPGSVTAPFLTPGSSDSLFFRARGVPAFGFLPALLSDELNASVHGLDERIPLLELERALRVSYRVLRRLTE